MLSTLACLILAFANASGPVASSHTPTSHKTSPASVDAMIQVAGPMDMARLRRLHLVRPDLVVYPLAVDVYC